MSEAAGAKETDVEEPGIMDLPDNAGPVPDDVHFLTSEQGAWLERRMEEPAREPSAKARRALAQYRRMVADR